MTFMLPATISTMTRPLTAKQHRFAWNIAIEGMTRREDLPGRLQRR